MNKSKSMKPELLRKYCNLIIENTKPMVKLQMGDEVNKKEQAIRSQFAGTPYWPAGKAKWNELVKQYGDLSLLVQLDLSQVSDPRLPQTGLLQVFVIGDYSEYEEDPTEHESVKGRKTCHIVIYHENLETNDVVKSTLLEDYEAYQINSEHGTSILNLSNDYDVERLFEKYGISDDDSDDIYEASDLDSFKELGGSIKDDKLKALFDKALKLMEDDQKNSMSRMGGYPHFTQGDERSENSRMTELLVQLSSDDTVMFGDVGDIQVFTTKEQLSNVEPGKVWDSYYLFQCY